VSPVLSQIFQKTLGLKGPNPRPGPSAEPKKKEPVGGSLARGKIGRWNTAPSKRTRGIREGDSDVSRGTSRILQCGPLGTEETELHTPSSMTCQTCSPQHYSGERAPQSLREGHKVASASKKDRSHRLSGRSAGPRGFLPQTR